MYHEQTPRQGWQEQQQIALKKKKEALYMIGLVNQLVDEEGATPNCGYPIG